VETFFHTIESVGRVTIARGVIIQKIGSPAASGVYAETPGQGTQLDAHQVSSDQDRTGVPGPGLIVLKDT